MSEINTTSINDLPTDPVAGGSIGGDVKLLINEVNSSTHPSQSQPNNSQLSLDQSTISQIVNGLQQASLTGVTSLPSRDIPLHTEQLTSDAQIQPNYVPPPQTIDYINESDDDIQNYYNKEKRQNSLKFTMNYKLHYY